MTIDDDLAEVDRRAAGTWWAQLGSNQ